MTPRRRKSRRLRRARQREIRAWRGITRQSSTIRLANFRPSSGGYSADLVTIDCVIHGETDAAD